MGVPVLLWHARQHVSAHVTGPAHGQGWREEEEILLPCPLIVFSVQVGPAQPCGSIRVFQGTGLGEGQPASVTCPLSCLWCLETTQSHRRCPDLNISSSLALLFIISPLVCSASSLCLSNAHKHTLKHEQHPPPPSFPPPGTFSSVYSPKLHFPNKVKVQLQRLCAQLLSHPIWKSCFFPCGPGVLFTGDSRAGNGAPNVLRMMHMPYISKSHNVSWLFFFLTPSLVTPAWTRSSVLIYVSSSRTFTLKHTTWIKDLHSVWPWKP